MLDAKKIEEKVPAFAQQLSEKHSAAGWKNVLEKTAEMMLEMGRNNPIHAELLAKLALPVRLGLGDHDNMVSIEETIAIFRQIPGAELFVMPATQHPIEKIPPTKIAGEILSFMGE